MRILLHIFVLLSGPILCDAGVKGLEEDAAGPRGPGPRPPLKEPLHLLVRGPLQLQHEGVHEGRGGGLVVLVQHNTEAGGYTIYIIYLRNFISKKFLHLLSLYLV